MAKILAELTYEVGQARWGAIVTKGEDSAGSPVYILEIESNGRKGTAGLFTHGKALVKWARERAKEKFGSATPVVDTMRAVENRAPASLVPDCYLIILDESIVGEGRGFPECPLCPYRSRCGDSQNISTSSAIEPEQTEEEKAEKLKALIAAKWGNLPESD